MTKRIAEKTVGTRTVKYNSLNNPLEEETTPGVEWERENNSEATYIGRPERWSEGSTFEGINELYRRLAIHQWDALLRGERKRLSWERVIGSLSKFFSVKYLDQALQILVRAENRIHTDEVLIISVLGAIDCLLRLKHRMLSHQTLREISKTLNMNIRKEAIRSARYQLIAKVPQLRPLKTYQNTNMVMRGIAAEIIARHTLTPEEKKRVLEQAIKLAKEMLRVRYYPQCAEVNGYAVALALINVLNKKKGLPNCRIPSADIRFRKQVSNTALRLRKRFKWTIQEVIRN